MSLKVFSGGKTDPPHRRKIFAYSFEETPVLDDVDRFDRIEVFAPINAYLYDLAIQQEIIHGGSLPAVLENAWRWSHVFPLSLHRSLKVSIVTNFDSEFLCHAITTRSFLKINKSTTEKLATKSHIEAIAFLATAFELPLPKIRLLN